MRFEWDEEKNKTNIQKHGIDFADACEMFSLPLLTAVDDRQNYGEDRWIGIGMLRGRVVVAAFTERGEETVRIISVRKALKHESERYEQVLRDQLGSG